MKLQVTASVQNLAFHLLKVFYHFLKSFKVCLKFEKVAEHMPRVPTFDKKSVAFNCQSSDGWMFEKTDK